MIIKDPKKELLSSKIKYFKKRLNYLESKYKDIEKRIDLIESGEYYTPDYLGSLFSEFSILGEEILEINQKMIEQYRIISN